MSDKLRAWVRYEEGSVPPNHGEIAVLLAVLTRLVEAIGALPITSMPDGVAEPWSEAHAFLTGKTT